MASKRLSKWVGRGKTLDAASKMLGSTSRWKLLVGCWSLVSFILLSVQIVWSNQVPTDPTTTPVVVVPGGTLETQMVILYTTLGGVATTIAGLIVAVLREDRIAKAAVAREERHRKYDLDDRAEQRKILAEAQERLDRKIQQSNLLSENALKTANGFTQKLIDISTMFTSVERDAVSANKTANEALGYLTENSPSPTLKRVDETTQVIAEQVTAIEGQIKQVKPES